MGPRQDGRWLNASLDGMTPTTLSTLPARLLVGVLMAVMTGFGLGWRIAVMWAAANASAEVWTWVASRPQRARRTQSRPERLHYLASVLFMNLVWSGLACRLWVTEAPALQLWALGLLATQMVHAQLFNARSNALLVIVGGLPAVTLISLCAFVGGNFGQYRWLMVVNAILMVGYLAQSAFTNRRNALTLEQARTEAVAASELKGQFLAMMSHEMRTPLNGVLGMARALASEDLSGPQVAQARTLVKSGEDLLTLLNDSLDLSKIEAGRLDLEHVPFDLAEEIRQLADMWRPSAVAKGLALDVVVSLEPDGWVVGDPTRLRQILNNLIGNAVKFTETGSVLIRVTAAPEGEGHREVMITVQDTGCGIAHDRLEQIFNPYAQADASIGRRFGGTGLGLGIARRLANAMGGEIAVESKMGVGSTFSVSLRLQRGAPSSIGNAQAFDGLTIGVIDDNAVNCSVASIVLRTVGAQAVSFLSGEVALEHLRSTPVDVLLVDLHMPGMNGFEVLAAIRRDHILSKHTPIIAMTGDNSDDAVAAMRDAGFSAIETKPLDPGRLLTTIMRELSLAAQADPARAMSG